LMVLHVAMTRSPLHVVTAIAGNMLGVGTLAAGALLGLAAVLAAFPWARLAIQILGAAYLVYFGWRLIQRSRGPKTAIVAAVESGDAPEGSTGHGRTFAVGFLTAVSNAQAIAFVTGIYAVTGILQANLATGLASIAIMICCNTLYLGTLGWLFQRPAVRMFYSRFRNGFETTIGVLFIILGGRLLWRELVG
jgi:threonine efflux protein